MEKKNLPKIQDLYQNKELAVKQSEFAILCNQEPHPQWVKKHPLYGNNYIPIEIQEWLMTMIFTRWWVEILDIKQILNGAVVTVRVYAVDPTTGETIHQDGAGAHSFQLNKGAKATDFNELKNESVMLAVPIAESRAFSDAVDKFGKLFGKDLNRKNGMNYDKLADKFNKEKEELTPDHEKWSEAVKSLNLGNTTIEEIKKNFTLSETNEKQLKNEAI